MHIFYGIVLLCFASVIVAQDIKNTSNTYRWQQPSSNQSVQVLAKPINKTLVENFEDRSLKGWWGFGNLLFTVVENSVGQYDPVFEGRSVKFEGIGNQRYVGGFGRILGIDASRFNALQMTIKGNLPKKSARLIIELYCAKDDQ